MSRFETMSNRTDIIHEEPGSSLASSAPSSTITITSDHANTETATIRLRLTRKLSQSNQSTSAVTRRRVSWTTETVDNEFLNKKKSKCCCVYQKPRKWNESSSEDENEDHDCQNCRGHRKSDFNKNKPNDTKEQQADGLSVCADLESINIRASPTSEHKENSVNSKE